MANLFNSYIYQPIFDSLVWLYNLSSDMGLAVILLTIGIRIVLFPLFYKGSKDQALMQKMSPKLKEIQKKYKDNKEKQVQEIMALYQEYKVNPFSSFFLLLLQLPVFFALFKVFSKGIGELEKIGVDLNFFGLINMGKPSLVLVFLAAGAQYWQGKVSMAQSDKKLHELSPMERMSRNMIFIMPGITLVILFKFQSALALYWLTTSLFSVMQQVIINKRIKMNEA